mmetsp:Transcript_13042/g.19705  ORF Transcript_13042/g.19705 Transcript_13042/m.19705 type:complete len:158 (-) Transcript_13042:146-619(-)
MRLGYWTSHQVKSHGFFKGLDWRRALRRDYDPPFHPCRPKKYRDSSDGKTKLRVEAVLGLGNFGKDQRDLAMEHYNRNRSSEHMMSQTMASVALPASVTAAGLKMYRGKKSPVNPQWPIFRGFQLAESRPPTGPPPTGPPPTKPARPPEAGNAEHAV